jgi:IS1 transposase
VTHQRHGRIGADRSGGLIEILRKKQSQNSTLKNRGRGTQIHLRICGPGHPPECIGTRVIPIIGQPNPRHISTSYVERQNLTMRMRMRRFTRLTNAFSKKVENHGWAVALYFMHYNFCRIHQTLRVTPAMEAGITDHVWTIEEMVTLLDQPISACA